MTDDILRYRLERAKELSEQIILHDGNDLPQDIYILTRKLFIVLHEGDKRDG